MFSIFSKFTPFVSLSISLWPLAVSINVFALIMAVVLWFHYKVQSDLVILLTLHLCVIAFVWWRDVMRESLLGLHTSKLEVSFRFGIGLFILSEVFFFLSFFWAFYDSSLSPSIELGISWPPLGILPLSAYSVPLLNTIILLTSGVSVTWAHHRIINNLFSQSVFSLGLTVLLGVYFLIIQYEEYCESAFSISDGVYGTTFFVSTGFHGLHVIIGTTFLIYVFILLTRGFLTYNHHFSFEAAAWYWHFVDVVWLFLYVSIYWWGGL